MKLYELKTNQFIRITAEEAWAFFSSPKNLQLLTPEYMGFEIKSELNDKMYAGQIISYIVRPILNIPMSWVTEITHVEELKYFVDEQRFGPYKFWHHKHFIKIVDGGIEMEDIVHYGLPFGFIGRIVNYFIVRKKLEQIFSYREEKIKQIFNASQ